MKNWKIKIDERLMAIAKFVQPNSNIADIGTDHAYLPIWLVQNNLIHSAIVTDINNSPIIRAENNIKTYRLSDKIKTYQTDGLIGIDRFCINDIIIAGMGAKLIENIIDSSQFVRNSQYKLILQPMTLQPILRKYLYDNEFNILDEALGIADNKLYQVIYAEFNGKKSEYSLIELIIGRKNIENRFSNVEIFNYHVKKQLISAQTRVSNMKIANLDTISDEKLINDLFSLII